MQSPGDRKNLTNIERNNQPIEVEKGNIVTYTVEFRNNASGAVGNHDSTQLYNMNLAGSFNGRTGVFEAHNECSTHSPAAKKDSYSNCFIFLIKNRYRVLNI